MGAMQNAFTAVACILLLALTGAAIYLAGWLRDEHLPLLSGLVIKVALPCMILNNVLGQYTPESLAENLPALAAALLSVLLTLLIALPIGKALKLPGPRLGVFVVMFAFSNSVFIGVPVSRALFGEEATPYTLLYYIANTSLFWGVGFPLMRKWGGATPSGKRRLPPAPLIVFLACVALVFLRFSPPQFLMDTCGYLGNLVTPLSLLFIGAVMARMVRRRSFRWEKGYLAACVGRFIVCPGLMLACALIARVPDLPRDVLLVQAGMPVMTQTALVAATTGSDEEYAAGATALTTVLSLLMIPLYMLLIEKVL